MTDATARQLIHALERNTTALMEALPYLAGLDRLKSAREFREQALEKVRDSLTGNLTSSKAG